MTKIAKIIGAGRGIEETQTGFTVPDLMSALNWDEKEKQYVQNTMFNLTKKGQVFKLSNTRPVVYSFKAKSTDSPDRNATAGHITALKTPKAEMLRNEVAPAVSPKHARKDAVLSREDLADMDITLELVGEGVFRRNRELERKIYELESELIETKRKLDDAHKRISEQTRMIEKQNQIISGQNRDRKPAVKLQEVTSITWKRHS
jgi:hypothetical protein